MNTTDSQLRSLRSLAEINPQLAPTLKKVVCFSLQMSSRLSLDIVLIDAFTKLIFLARMKEQKLVKENFVSVINYYINSKNYFIFFLPVYDFLMHYSGSN